MTIQVIEYDSDNHYERMGIAQKSILSSQCYIAKQDFNIDFMCDMNLEIVGITSDLWSILPTVIENMYHGKSTLTKDDAINMLRESIDHFIDTINELEKSIIDEMKSKVN